MIRADYTIQNALDDGHDHLLITDNHVTTQDIHVSPSAHIKITISPGASLTLLDAVIKPPEGHTGGANTHTNLCIESGLGDFPAGTVPTNKHYLAEFNIIFTSTPPIPIGIDVGRLDMNRLQVNLFSPTIPNMRFVNGTAETHIRSCSFTFNCSGIQEASMYMGEQSTVDDVISVDNSSVPAYNWRSRGVATFANSAFSSKLTAEETADDATTDLLKKSLRLNSFDMLEDL